MSVAATQDSIAVTLGYHFLRKRQRYKSRKITIRYPCVSYRSPGAGEIVVLRPQDPDCSNLLVVTVTQLECLSHQKSYRHSQLDVR